MRSSSDQRIKQIIFLTFFPQSVTHDVEHIIIIWINVWICGEVKPENTFSVTTLTQGKFIAAQPATAQGEESNVNSHIDAHGIGMTSLLWCSLHLLCSNHTLKKGSQFFLQAFLAPTGRRGALLGAQHLLPLRLWISQGYRHNRSLQSIHALQW